MQINEFIEATGTLEKYYNKEFSTEQRQIMYEELKHLSLDRYRQLISKCLRTCKYMPKISDIIEAEMALIGEVKEDKREIFPCTKCDGSGYVLYTKFKTNGNTRIPYTYAARCDCENAKYANQKIPSYLELGITVSTRINQVKDTHRSIESIKSDLINNFTA